MKAAFKELVLSVAKQQPETYLFGFDASRHGIIPERTIDFPVCEETIVGAGLGAARAGAHVFVDLMFLPFIFRAFDVVVNQFCLSKFLTEVNYGSLTIRARCGPFEGAGPQHGNEVPSLLAEVPALLVAFPRFESSVLPLFSEARAQGKTLLLLESPFEMADTFIHEASPTKVAINIIGGYAPIVEFVLNADQNLAKLYYINPIESLDDFYSLRGYQLNNQLTAFPKKPKASGVESISIFPEALPHTWENAVQHVREQLTTTFKEEMNYV